MAQSTLSTNLVKLNVNNNTINYARKGINIQNCNGDASNTYYCNIAYNTINFEGLGTSTYPFIGINSSSCAYANIEQNTIQYNPTATPNYVADYDKLKGISVTSVQNAKVRKNILVRLGIGIWGADNLLGTQFFCNDLDKNYYGFYFLPGYANISNQVSSSAGGKIQASDNYWYDNPNFTSSEMRRIGGAITNWIRYWYHRGNNNDIGNIFSPYIITNHPVEPFINSTPNISANPDCNIQISPVASPKAREEAMGDIVKDSVSYQANPIENKYYAEDFAYKSFDENPAMLTMGVAEDSIYQQFYNENKIKGIGKFTDIDKYIFNEQYNDAILLNNTIIPVNSIESNKKTVNHIYLHNIINNQTISTFDSITLYNIANQLPFFGGDAVYSARVILGLEPANLSLDYTKGPPTQLTSSFESDNVFLYPNPSLGSIYLEFDSEIQRYTTFEIYDINSRLIYSTVVPIKTLKFNINLNSVKSGIYYCRVINDIRVLLSRKLIINNK